MTGIRQKNYNFKMKVIITGISGFVGQNLSQYLEKHGCAVFPLSLRQEWSLVQNSDAIIHLAGKAHDTSNTADAQEYFKVNRDLTIKLFDQFLNSDSKDFFYFSSVKASADTVEGVLDENSSANPQTPYGKSKLEAEQFLLSKDLPTGKRMFIIRPCMIHGPGNKGNLNLLYKIVEKKIPWPLAAFENQRSFLSVSNLNYLILSMLQNNKISSGVYNFADDDPLSTNDLVKLIAETLNRKPQLWKINSGIITSIAKLGNLLNLPLNSERLKKLTESYVVSNRKIKKEFGIDHLPVNAKEGLKKTLKSFRI